jgi:hypothetical protein
MKGYPIEVLVAYGKHEVLEGDPIEEIVIAKFANVKPQRIGITAKPTKASPNTAKMGRSITESLSKVSANPRTVPAPRLPSPYPLRLIPLTLVLFDYHLSCSSRDQGLIAPALRRRYPLPHEYPAAVKTRSNCR